MKKLSIGFLQFVALMGALLGLMFFVASRQKAMSEGSDSAAGTLQFETEDHMLYALQIIGAQPTSLKPGQFANLYIRQIFEVKGSAGERNALSGWTASPCTPQTPCALFLQAKLLQKTDHDAPRNTLKVADSGVPIKLEWR